MRPEYLTRHVDLLDPTLAASKKIHIIGAGAIGSFTALSLAKMGYTDITVYDDDVVDPENMNCQFYPTSAIEEKKVYALAKLIMDFTGVAIEPIAARVSESDLFTGDFLIVAVDNMETRKKVYSSCFATNTLIDPRMGAEYATLEVVRQGDDTKNYEGTLFEDSEAVQERCTAKSTVYTSMMIAGQICKVVKDITNEHNYMKSMEWDIKSNAMLAWDAMGRKL